MITNMYSMVTRFLKEVSDNQLVFYGHKIPKGTLVMPNLYSVQMDEK